MGEPETAEVIVPAGCGPGNIFRAIIADGRELTIRCPDDGGPGDVLRSTFLLPTTMMQSLTAPLQIWVRMWKRQKSSCRPAFYRGSLSRQRRLGVVSLRW